MAQDRAERANARRNSATGTRRVSVLMQAAHQSLFSIFLKTQRVLEKSMLLQQMWRWSLKTPPRPLQAKHLNRTRMRMWPPHQALVVKLRKKRLAHLQRKASNHELPDVDAETQTQAFDYLYRESSESKAPDKDAETQPEEFDDLIPKRSGYQTPDREFFKSEERVRFYTGLSSYEILMVVFEQVAPHVNRRTQTLTNFKNLFWCL